MLAKNQTQKTVFGHLLVNPGPEGHGEVTGSETS